ncbi:MAG: hypothetical protein ACXWQA_15355, partial [Pseudobdellovibrionaceae bacterium]
MKKIFLRIVFCVRFFLLAVSFYFLTSCLFYGIWLEGMKHRGWAKFDPNTAELLNGSITWVFVPPILYGVLLAFLVLRRFPKFWVLLFFLFSCLFNFIFAESSIYQYASLSRVPGRLAILTKLYGDRIDGCKVYSLGMEESEVKRKMAGIGRELTGPVSFLRDNPDYYSISWCPDPLINPAMGFDNSYRSIYFD